MDNKSLADFIRVELSKVTVALNKLILTVSAPREQDKTSQGPQSAPNQENDTAPWKMTLPTYINPAPNNTNQPKKPWYKTMQGWKTLLELIAIPFAIGYAFITYFQWRDLKRNFATEQRAWVMVQNGDINIKGKVGETLATDLMITNNGRTPAEHVTGNIILTVLLQNDALDTNYGDGHLQSKVSSGTILPNIPERFPVTGVFKPKNGPIGTLVISDEFLQGLSAGLARIVVYGRLDYLDVNGTPHWMTFCNHMGGNNRVPGCAEYNAIDHNY